MAFIHLIRHGQASFGGDDYDQLSKLGERQGEAVAKRFTSTISKCSIVVCGSMKRHRQTAEAASKVISLPEASINSQWNEFDHIDVIRCFRPELADQSSMREWIASQDEPLRAFQNLYEAATSRWISGDHDEDYAESRRTFTERVYQGLDSVASELRRGDIALIFTSGGPIGAITQKVLELSDKQTQGVDRTLVNGGVTTLSVKDGEFRLISLNCYGHLEMERESLISYR